MMLIKLGAIMLILAATVGLARRAARPYAARVHALVDWQHFLRRLIPLIEWQRMPLPEALSRAARGCKGLAPDVASLVMRIRQPDADLLAAWNRMLESQSGLWDADRAALGNLGRALGWSDVAYQHEHLDVALRDLEALTAEARLRLAKDGHLFQAMVGALGVMVVILML